MAISSCAEGDPSIGAWALLWGAPCEDAVGEATVSLVIPGVPARFFRMNLDIVERAGHATGAAERALFPAGIDLGATYPWDLYADLGDRMGQLLGSAEDVMEAYATWAGAIPSLADAFAQVTDPLEVARRINTEWSDVLRASTFFRVIDPRTYEYGYEIPAGLAGTQWGSHISGGLLAGQPLLIGLPRAHVEPIVLAERRCHFRVTLPPQRALVLDRPLAHDVAERAAALVRSLAKETHGEREEGASLRARCLSFGAALSGASDAEDAALRAVRFLSVELPASFVLLWVRTGRVSKLLAHAGERVGESRVLPLFASGRHVGDLEIPHAIDSLEVTALLPLLASDLARRLAAPRGWQLTEAEHRVCELVARGEANKGIAQALALSVATVEEHVSSILRKSGAHRRTEIVARWREGVLL